MNMKKTVMTLAALVLTLTAFAGPIGKQQAMNTAKAFMKEVNANAVLQATTVRHAPGMNGATDVQPYYVFNAENNEGFVIVAGDDRSEEILGYSDIGSIDVNNMPEALKSMLDGFVEDLKELDELGLTELPTETRGNAPRKAVAVSRQPVAPLTKSTWTQGVPYNSKTTLYESGNHGPVGCMATATGQLIYFWKYANIQYTIPGYGSFSSLPPREFDFSKLRDSYPYTIRYGNYSYDYSTEEWNLIGEFMEYIDRAMQASFGETSTYIYPQGVPEKLKKYFGYKYDGAIHREECGGAEFENYIYNDLSQGMPVWTAGYSIPDRHGFVIDGYSFDDFFHINWGWEGLCNGYFRLGPLNAFNTSTKHSYGKHYFAMIGARPDDGVTKLDYKSYAPVATASADLKDMYFTTSDGTTVTTERNASSAFTSSLTVELQNWTNSVGSNYVRDFDVEMSLYNSNMKLVGQLKPDVEKVSIKMGNNSAVVNYTLGSKLHEMNLADGEYKLVPRSRMYGQNNYFFDRAKGPYAYVKVTKSGSSIKLSLVPTYTVDSYETIGQLKNNYRAALRVYFTNNSFTKLANTLVLYKSSIANGNTQDVQQLRIEPQSSGYVDLGFAVGSSTSNQTLLVVDKDLLKEIPSDIAQQTGINYGTTVLSATFKGNTNTTTSSELNCYWKVENSSGGTIYGNELHGYVEIENNGAKEYQDFFTLQTRTGYSSYNSAYKYVSSVTPLKIPAGGRARISLDVMNYADIFDALKNGNSTNIGFSLYDGSYDEDNVADQRGLIDSKTWTYNSKAILWWDKNGKMTATASMSSIPEEAVAVSFLNKGAGSLKPNKNPNTIYYFTSAPSSNSSFSSKNVVVAQSATATKSAPKAIAFDDAYDAYVPYGFTASKGVSYKRTFDYGYEKNGDKGWTTICLPFTVESIKNGSTSIDWFHSASDKNKLFWVNQFYGEDFTKTLYTYTEAILGNKPYLIAMPDESWGTRWSLTNKTITFSAGNNAKVFGGYNIVDGLPIVDADNQNFVSAAMAYRDMQNGKSVYSMENPGNDFVYVPNPDLKSFRGYITKETAASLVNLQSISIINLGENDFEGGETDDIQSIENGILTIDNNVVYDMQGRVASTTGLKALPKGMYIMNGKKFVIK